MTDQRSTAARAAADLAAALGDPARHAAHLAAALNDPGLRDALIVIAARGGRWDDLAAAAREGERAAPAAGASVHGPRAVLGLAHWVRGNDLSAMKLLDSIAADDPARRLADAVQQAALDGSGAAELAARIGAISIEDCIAFTAGGPGSRPPAPARPPAAAADAPEAATWALLGAGYSSTAGTRIPAPGGPGIRVRGPDALMQILDRAGGAGSGIVVAVLDADQRLHHIHRINGGGPAAARHAAQAAGAALPPADPFSYAIVAGPAAAGHARGLADELVLAWPDGRLIDVLQEQPGGNWLSLVCTDPGCCPPGGYPLREDPLLRMELDAVLGPPPEDPLAAPPPDGPLGPAPGPRR